MNAGTIFVLVVLVVISSLIVRKMIRDKRAGKTCGSCGGNCSCCSPKTKAKVHEGKGRGSRV